MAEQQILISQKYLMDKSIINNNADYDLLVPVIVICQDLKIKPLLGSDLYNLVLTEAGTGTFTLSNKLLLDTYILPTLLWYIAAECPVVFKFRFMNTGIMEKSTENSQQTSTSDIRYLEDKYTHYAENYANQLIKYILAYPDQFPSYMTNNTLDKTRPERAPFTAGGLYLDQWPGYYGPRRIRNDSDIFY